MSQSVDRRGPCRQVRFALAALTGLLVTVLSGCGLPLEAILVLMLDPGHGAQVATAPVARPPDALYLAAAAHSTGVQGTNWRSDAELLCVGPEGCEVTVEALLHGRDNSSPVSVELGLGAATAVRMDDVLETQFGVDGSAALRITPSAGAVIATSRTYNLLGPGKALGLPAGASFGQYIPAAVVTDAIHAGETGRLQQLGEDASRRTNVAFVNATAAPLAVEVELFNAAGASLGSFALDLQPLE